MRLDRLTKKLNSFVRLTPREIDCLVQLQSSPIRVEKGRELICQGHRGEFAYILQAGWGCSFKVLQNGERQVITFPIPGDCVGLRSVLLRTSDHSFQTITEATVCRVDVPRMLRVFNEFPHIGSAVLWATSRDEAMTVEHLASVGRRSAIERTAHFFLELSARLTLVDLSTNGEFDCPLNQYELADALGLSAIHINRVLRQLREMSLLTVHNHIVTIDNLAGLKLLAGYEDIEGGAVLQRDWTTIGRNGISST